MSKKLVVLAVLFTSGCGVDPVLKKVVVKDSAPMTTPIDVMEVVDAVPKYEKRTRAGNPPEYEVFGKQYKVLEESKGYQKRGVASWYGTKFHGKNTSNGEVYDMYGMTAAHKTLPIPSYVRVTNLKNQKSIVVRINDRGPFHNNREIDLSYAAAIKLGIQREGTGFVEVIALESERPEVIESEYAELFRQQKGMAVYLQVGAFTNQVFASQLQEKFIVKQITESRIQVAENQGNQIYKVQVGPFYTDQQVDNVNKKLARLGYADTKLIVEKKM